MRLSAAHGVSERAPSVASFVPKREKLKQINPPWNSMALLAPELPTLAHIRAARKRISGVVHETPLLGCRSLSEMVGGELFFKCENFQKGGAFKIRGAYNKLASLAPEDQARGVAAFSSGNHAQGVALAAKLLGIQATIFMPVDSPRVKLAGVREYGAEIVMVGTTSAERREACLEFAERSGTVVIPPFDDPGIIAGQGTVGLEILEQCPEVTRVVVPIGGGGLISGVSLAVRSLAPEVEIIGVEPELAAKMSVSLEAGMITPVLPGNTLADGLKPVSPGIFTFEAVRRNVDRVLTVPEEEIAKALPLIMERAKLVVEPSAVVGLAACLSGEIDCSQGITVLILSGGNIDLAAFFRALPATSGNAL